jgi:ferric-dicitrate binding protein FerR (iron transport regulator)/lysophospholipase L1-like esterase
MTNPRAVELYLLYLDGALDEPRAREFRDLLDSDLAARERVLDDLEIHGMLGQLFADDREMFARSLSARLDAESTGPEFVQALDRRLRRPIWRWSGVAAAAVLVAAAAFFFWPKKSEAPAPVVVKPQVVVPKEMPDPVRKADEKPLPPPPPPPEPAPPMPKEEPAPEPPKRETRTAVARVDGRDVFENESINGPAGLEFPDGTRLSLFEGSQVTLRGELSVDRGVVSAEVAKQKQPLIFATPHARVKVIGTSLAIVVEKDRTRVDVTEGRVQVNGVDVRKGQFAVVVPGQPVAAKPLTNTKAQANAYDDGWDWATHLKSVYKTKGKTAGFVLQIGDSITWARPYEHWPSAGPGKTPEDRDILEWCHAHDRFGQGDNDTRHKNGFYLATANTTPSRGMTSGSGIGAVELLGGGGMPVIKDPDKAREAVIDSARYPKSLQIDTVCAAFNDAQFAVVMLGTMDLRAGRNVSEFIQALSKIVGVLEKHNIVVVLSTIPPHAGKDAASYNDEIRKLARERRLPLIDLYAEILARRPGNTWDGTLIRADDMHPSAQGGGFDATACDPYLPGGNPATHATGDACLHLGYLLRSWLTVQKLKEVRDAVSRR